MGGGVWVGGSGVGRLLVKAEKLLGKHLIIAVTRKFHFMNGHSMTHGVVPPPHGAVCRQELYPLMYSPENRPGWGLKAQKPADSFPFCVKLDVVNPFLVHIQ